MSAVDVGSVQAIFARESLIRQCVRFEQDCRGGKVREGRPVGGEPGVGQCSVVCGQQARGHRHGVQLEVDRIQCGDRHAGFNLTQEANDLLFGKTLLHVQPSSGGGLDSKSGYSKPGGRRTLGPIFGAVLVDSLGWRSTYIAQLPLAVVCFGLGEFLLSPDPGDWSGRWFDWKGRMLLCISVSGLLLTLTSVPEGTLEDPLVPTVCTFSVIGFLAFLHRQFNVGVNRLVEVELLAVPRFAIANLIAFSVGFALYGSLLLIPLYLQSVLQLSATTSGLVLLPAGLLMVALSPLGGRLSDVLAPRMVVTIGMLAFSISIAMMAEIGPMTSFLEIIAAVCIGRMGLACLFPSLYLSAFRSVPSDAISQAAGIINFSRQLGGTIGVATVAVLLQGRVAANWQVFANDIDREVLHSAFGGVHAFAELFASRDGWVWARTFAYREVLLATSAGVLLVAVGGLFMGNKASLTHKIDH